MPELPQKTDPASNEHCKGCPAPGDHEPASMLVAPDNSPKPAPSPASSPGKPVVEPTPGPEKPGDAPKEAPAQHAAPKEAAPKEAAPKAAPADPTKDAAPIGSVIALQFGYSGGEADPKQLDNEQMSKLDQALAPAPSPSSDSQKTSQYQSQPKSDPQNNSKSPGQSGSGSQPGPEGGHQAPPVSQADASGNNDPSEPTVAGSNSPNQPQPIDPYTKQSSSQQNKSPVRPEDQSSEPLEFAPEPSHVALGSNTFELPKITNNPAPVVNGNPVVELPDGKHQVGNTVLYAGGPPAVVEGTTVQLNKHGAAVVNGKTYDSQPTAATSVVSGHTIVNSGGSGVKVDGVSLPTGGTAPVQIGGTPVQINKQGSPIIDGHTYSILPSTGSTQVAGHTIVSSDYGYTVDGHQVDQGAPPVKIGAIPAYVVYNSPSSNKAAPGIQLPASPSVVTTLPGGQKVQANDGVYQLANQPLSKGGPAIVVSGSTYSLDPSNNVHVNNQVFNLPKITSPPTTTIAGQAVVPLPNGVSIGGHTLHAGDGPITISNSISISLGSSALVIGSSTVPVNQQSLPSLPTISAAGHILTQAPNNDGYAISGTTLRPGSDALIISGTPYSLAPSGSALIIGSSTIPLATAPSNGPLVAAGETFTPVGASAVAIDGSTLSVGGSAITDSKGTVVSLASGGLVVGSSTFAFAAMPASTSASTTDTVSSSVAGGVAPVSTANNGSVAGSTPAPPPSAGAGPTGANASPSEATAWRETPLWRSMGISALLTWITITSL